MRTTIDAIVGTVQMSGIQQEAEQGLESGQLTEASAEAFFEAKKGQITESLWKLNVLDMEGTLTRVVDRVCACLALHWHCVNEGVQGSCHLMSQCSDAGLGCAVLCWAVLCWMQHSSDCLAMHSPVTDIFALLFVAPLFFDSTCFCYRCYKSLGYPASSYAPEPKR